MSCVLGEQRKRKRGVERRYTKHRSKRNSSSLTQKRFASAIKLNLQQTAKSKKSFNVEREKSEAKKGEDILN